MADAILVDKTLVAPIQIEEIDLHDVAPSHAQYRVLPAWKRMGAYKHAPAEYRLNPAFSWRSQP
ncbi:hypothetical protein D3C80_2046600 [compost metagenome]